jgi:hypothetical protein
LIEPPPATLVRLSAIQKVEEPHCRAEVGRRRSQVTADSDHRPSALAGMIRVHPRPGEPRRFYARYGGYAARGVQLHLSRSDRRSAWMEFPGASQDDFAPYHIDDEVHAVGTLSPPATPHRLVLTGLSMRRLEEPKCEVSAD